MTPEIDLMPEECRVRLGRRSWVRRWVAGYAAAAVVLALLVIGTEIREQAKRSSAAALQKQVDYSVEQRQKAELLTAKIEALDAALEQHDALALPVPVVVALRTLGACTPETVTLTSLSMIPRIVRERASIPGKKSSEDRWLLFELRGVAPSDTDLAQFLAALETSPLFSTASVDFTTRTTVRGAVAREFGMTCQIALERDFVFENGVAP